jgi:NADPH-dependent curcumin reductase CurA
MNCRLRQILLFWTVHVAGSEIRLPEHVEKGIERYPAALDRLFTGGHMGKLLVTP